MLLMLPITVVDIEPLSFVDALFMSASAVCVSGVSIFSLGDNFSVFGQIIIIILVQIGALGLAGVNITMPLINLTFAIGIMIAIGSSTMIAIHYGEGD